MFSKIKQHNLNRISNDSVGVLGCSYFVCVLLNHTDKKQFLVAGILIPEHVFAHGPAHIIHDISVYGIAKLCA